MTTRSASAGTPPRHWRRSKGSKMVHKGKTIALSTVAVGLVVLVAAGIVSKDRILEKWYLHQLETGTPEAKEQALQILAKVGSEESLMKLEEYRLHDAPVIIFRWGL